MTKITVRAIDISKCIFLEVASFYSCRYLSPLVHKYGCMESAVAAIARPQSEVDSFNKTVKAAKTET